MDIMIKIHLSRLLGEKRWTQKDLAEATGIRPSTINEWYHEFVIRIIFLMIGRPRKFTLFPYTALF